MGTTTPSYTRQEKVRQAKDVLNEHLNALAEQMRQGKSRELLRYLEFAAQFHQYSFRNVLLILAQKPNATRVAGLRHWNQLGRHVKPGEKGIMILAPMAVKKRRQTQESESDEDQEDHTITLFKVVYVFDVSQTEGEPLPSLLHASGAAASLYPALQAAVRRTGTVLDLVEHVPGSASAHGASFGGRIAVLNGLEDAEGFRTLAHEFAHEKLHWQGQKESKIVRETEADATAFVVCRHYGVHADTADYLLLYDATPEVLLARMETIRDTAAAIIAAIEREIGMLSGDPDNV